MADNTISVLIRAKDLASREFQKLERNIDKLKQNNTSLAKSTGDASTGFEMMGKAAGVVAAALGAMELVRTGVELANVGEEIRNAESRFEELTGGVNQASASLARMRAMTRYVATDAALMQGASDLLLMGIANTAKEAESIVELAIGLKRSTDTAADAINNFAIMIGNQSYLRLDSFGISAGRTRMRVEELLATAQAATREDAFRMAVLEIGEETMSRTINAIDETSTAYSRLKTDISNSLAEAGKQMEDFAIEVSDWAEQIYLTLNNNQERLSQQESRYLNTALRNASQITERASEYQLRVIEGYFKNFDLETILRAGEGQYNWLSQWFGVGTETDPAKFFGDLLEVPDRVVRQNARQIQSIVEAELRHQASGTKDMVLEQLRFTQRRGQQIRDAAALANQQQVDNMRNMMAMLESSAGQIFARGFFGDGDFFRADDLQMLDGVIFNLDQTVDHAQRLFEQELITEDELDSIKEIAKEMGKTASEAERAAAAFKNVSLSRLMGETGDRSTQELADLISEGIFNPEQAEGFTRSVERLTGARTAITDYIEGELAPITQALIARYGEDMGAQFAFNINQALETGLAMGLDPQTMVNEMKRNLGITTSEMDAITVHIPAMATWSNIYGDSRPLDEDGNPLTDEALVAKIEEDLNLTEGTVELNKPILYSIRGTGLTAQSLANLEGVRSDLLDVIFNDSQAPTLDLDAELEVNLPNVGIGRIMAMTGFTKQEIMQQLAAQGEDFHYDAATDRLYVNPGTFTFMPYRQVPITEADFSLSASAMRESAVFQETFDPFAMLLPNSQLLLENMQNFGAVDLSETQTQLDSADTTVTSIYDTTKLLTETVWTLTINVEVNEPEYSRILEEAVGRMNRDNGGRPPGTIYNPVNGRE